ncbi:phosphocarrier protein [Anaerosolibacter carboniphilus]|uniref:Phosphocarrier protein HPr n=1 Tax=Anaerosolibacter carboniphilus TaxID=1417629 RepID=A0A841KY53_9FIRM|nr:HPr family phosphocarrier protein [Anaerosolibacter carboniphilus]MBB6215842.1 phosphocarrier protein [Anaerosolibacter carboniphilus]
MTTREVTIVNKLGLHARPAALFVQMANKFTSDITVEKGSKRINAKSIMGIMSLGAGKGDVITLMVEGPDEEEAILELVDLIENKLLEL